MEKIFIKDLWVLAKKEQVNMDELICDCIAQGFEDWIIKTINGIKYAICGIKKAKFQIIRRIFKQGCWRCNGTGRTH
jgi:hypothetical protein